MYHEIYDIPGAFLACVYSGVQGRRQQDPECAVCDLCVCVHVIVYIPRLECLLRELERSILIFWFM